MSGEEPELSLENPIDHGEDTMVKVVFELPPSLQDATWRMEVEAERIENLEVVDFNMKEPVNKNDVDRCFEEWRRTLPTFLHFEPHLKRDGYVQVWSWPGLPAHPTRPFSYLLEPKGMYYRRIYPMGRDHLLLMGPGTLHSESHLILLDLERRKLQKRPSLLITLAPMTAACMWPNELEPSNQATGQKGGDPSSIEDKAKEVSSDRLITERRDNDNESVANDRHVILSATTDCNGRHPPKSTLRLCQQDGKITLQFNLPQSEIVDLLYCESHRTVLGLCRHTRSIYKLNTDRFTELSRCSSLEGVADNLKNFPLPKFTLQLKDERALPEWFKLSPEGHILVYCTGESRIHLFDYNQGTPMGTITLEPPCGATITRIVGLGFPDNKHCQLIYRVNLPSKFVKEAVVSHTMVSTVDWELEKHLVQTDNRWYCTMQ